MAQAVARAAAAVKGVYDDQSYTVSEKQPNDPLTSADLLANQILFEELGRLLPEAAWLSEETPDDTRRLAKSAAWIVDPIDGTREFVSRIPEFAVSVGLAIDGVPRAGCVAMPAEKRLAVGAVDWGVSVHSFDEQGRLSGGEKPATPPAETEPGRVRLVFSRSEQRDGLDRRIAPWKPRISGSIARKLALCALHEEDLCVSLRPKNEWDICGGIALILAGGGSALELKTGKEFRFNQAKTRSYGLVAGAAPAVEAFWQWSVRENLTVEKKHS